MLLLLSWIDASPEDLSAWIERLGSDCVVERERATLELGRAGAPALRPLRHALEHPDPEVAARAGLAIARIHATLPGTDLDLRDVDLDTLSRAVEGLTGITLSWTEDLGLRTRNVRFASEVYLGGSPELLLLAYRASLGSCDLALLPCGDGGGDFRIVPSPGRGDFRIIPPDPEPVTMILRLREPSTPEANDLLQSMATYPQNVLMLVPQGLVILTDRVEVLARLKQVLREYR